MHDSLVKLCTEFDDTNDIVTAKRVLYRCDAVIECGIRHQRRQGPSKDKTNMEDILLAFHRCSELPEFVASDLSCLPPLIMHNFDFAHLLHEFQGIRAEMTKLRHEVQLFKATMQVSQRDGPWSKPNKVASAVSEQYAPGGQPACSASGQVLKGSSSEDECPESCKTGVCSRVF